MALMKKIIPLLFFILLLAACTPGGEPNPAPIVTQTVGGYPAPEVSSTQPGYPGPSNPESAQSAAEPAPTINPSLAQVKGTFHLEKPPSIPYVLYLAPTVKDSKGQEIVFNFDRNIAIPAVPDNQGDFNFVNVPPGRYGMIFDLIATSYLMTVPGKQETLLITVNGNETVDLGRLNYEAPPE